MSFAIENKGKAKCNYNVCLCAHIVICCGKLNFAKSSWWVIWNVGAKKTEITPLPYRIHWSAAMMKRATHEHEHTYKLFKVK